MSLSKSATPSTARLMDLLIWLAKARESFTLAICATCRTKRNGCIEAVTHVASA